MSIHTKIVVILSFLLTSQLWAQDDKLAKTYYKNGDYHKAEVLYKTLSTQKPYAVSYLDYYIRSLQMQDKYSTAEKVLHNYLSNPNKKIKPKHKAFAQVLLGHNFTVLQDSINAGYNYETAFQFLKDHPSQGYQIAKKFHDVQALTYALDSYKFMVEANPGSNYYFQMATVYGELGDTQNMFDTLLGFISKYPDKISTVQRHFTRYLTNDNQDSNNILLRRALVHRIQNNPIPEWYKLLSWLYVFQKDYNKALVQEKAAFLQHLMDLSGVQNLGLIAFDDKAYDVAKNAFLFIKDHAQQPDDLIEAHYYIFETSKKTAEDLGQLQQSYTAFFEQFPPLPNNVPIQVSYADYLAFYRNDTKQSIALLEQAKTLTQNRFDEAKIKLKLGDILVFDGQYNRALILFTQIQNMLKNHPIGQMARFKVAQTSYFKGDFDWANVQLKVLKKSTSKLIANDAMDLSIRISSNEMKDSTDVAIKDFAKADLSAYQNKTVQAINQFSEIIEKYPGHLIIDDALFKQAQLYEKQNNYEHALSNYKKILDFNLDDIFYDDAVYHIARIYDEELFEQDNAKTYYEKIVLDYPSSIYLVKSRKRFRSLRGDEMIP